jgi:hypothetical protein
MKRLSRARIDEIIAAELRALAPRPTPGEAFAGLCAGIARADGKLHWVEKTPHHLLYAARISKHLPGAKFVVMVREPYAFLRSYKHQAGHEKTAESRQRFASRYHPIAGALVWRNSWRAAERLMRSAPERALLVRLEDVEKDAPAVLRRVLSFLEVDALAGDAPARAKVNSAFDSDAAPRPALSDADVAWMNFLAARDIAAAGYSIRSWRGNIAAVGRSIASLPAWLWRAARDLKCTTSGSVVRHALRWLSRPAPGAD